MVTFPSKNFRLPLPLFAALLVTTIAALAAGNLILLHGIHGSVWEVTAAQSVRDLGEQIARQLAAHAYVRDEGVMDREHSFSRLVHAIGRVEPAVQYVSITEDGVILYQEQLPPLDPGTASEPVESRAPVTLKRRLVDLGGTNIAILTFTTQVDTSDGRQRSVQIAIRKDAVAREAQGPAEALGFMFRMALITVIVSFSICIVLVIWLVRREAGRQDIRRREEHLAFAGALANGIIHDIRNPMSSLRLDAQMLGKEIAKGADLRPDRIEDLAARVRKTVDRTDSMLSEFLHLSGPDSAETESFDLNACVGDCVDLLQPRFEAKHLTLVFEPAATSPTIQAHPVQLKRAVINVLVNACHATPEEGTVTVRTRVQNQTAAIVVHDQGPGIAPSDRRKVFDMFYSTKPGGTGLGLTLARTAVNNYGGDVTVADSPESGACIHITIPIT